MVGWLHVVCTVLLGSKLKQIDLAATVEHLRDQRMDMVKTKVGL